MASWWPPKKNTAFDLFFVIRDNDGDPVTGATGLDSEVSKDNGAFADCTNEAVEIGTTGIYRLQLTSTEMNADAVVVQTKTSSANAKTAITILYTTESTWDEGQDVRAGGITTASFAAGAIDAAAVATDLQAELFGFQVPDSVPADGTRPTIAQALYMIVQFLYERAVSGTTVTVKKPNGTTTLLTLTLDDATNPTSITRST